MTDLQPALKSQRKVIALHKNREIPARGVAGSRCSDLLIKTCFFTLFFPPVGLIFRKTPLCNDKVSFSRSKLPYLSVQQSSQTIVELVILNRYKQQNPQIESQWNNVSPVPFPEQTTMATRKSYTDWPDPVSLVNFLGWEGRGKIQTLFPKKVMGTKQAKQ